MPLDQGRAEAFCKRFGLKLPINFDSPFKATSISEFWRRWHMTMTRLFTVFIYTPMAMRWKPRSLAGLFMAASQHVEILAELGESRGERRRALVQQLAQAQDGPRADGPRGGAGGPRSHPGRRPDARPGDRSRPRHPGYPMRRAP